MNEYIILKNNPDELILKSNSDYYVSNSLSKIIFLILWYCILISSLVRGQTMFLTKSLMEQIIIIIFFLVPLFLFKNIFITFITSLKGKRIIFDKKNNIFSIEGKYISNIDSIESIMIQNIEQGDNSTYYRIFINILDGRTNFLFESTDENYINLLTNEVSLFTCKKIKKEK